MAQISFSIVVVCLNPGEKLLKTVQSVLNQKYGNYEIVVKDGGSTDGSLEQLPADSRIRVAAVIERKRGRGADGEGLGHKEKERIFYGNQYHEAWGSVIYSAPEVNDFTCYRNVPCHQVCFYDVRLFAERGYDVKYRVRADYEHFLYCIYDRKAEAVYVEMIVADYEGGGFSETKENRRISEKEHAEITKRYLGRDKALRYKLLMLLTLAPLRTKLAEDEKYSEWYNGIKAKIYGRCGHKDEPGENRK